MSDAFKEWWTVVHFEAWKRIVLGEFYSEGTLSGICRRAFSRGREVGYEEGWTDGRNSEIKMHDPVCDKCNKDEMDTVLDYYEPQIESGDR